MNESVAFKQFDYSIKRIPKWLKDPGSLFYYFLLLVGLGVLFFSTTLFDNDFTTAFSGDYCSQQFSFYTNGYDDWWHFFKTGNFVLYDENTFLGVDNIGSNTFYYLFNPFFLPILLFPRQLIPQGMAILTIFKIALSGLTFYAYLRYLGASKRASKITGIAYAFSGWMTWYLWFNHFTEIAVVFPLILLGIERVLKTKKPWLLMGSICLLGFVNFFFTVCLTLCAFLYAMFRYFQRLRLNSAKDNLLIISFGFLGFAVGLLLPFMIFFPATMHSLTSPRASALEKTYFMEALKQRNIPKIWRFLTKWSSYKIENGVVVEETNVDYIPNNIKARHLYPFIDFIFPVTSDRGTPLTYYGNEIYDNVAGSQFCFLPMTMLLVPAFIDSFKKKHFSVIVPLVFFVFALFTPAAYFLFHGLTQAYSRWTIFVSTSILAYTGLYLDKITKEKWWILVIGGLSILVLCIVGGWAAHEIVTKYQPAYSESGGLIKTGYVERLSIPVFTIIECIYIVILCSAITILNVFKRDKNIYHVFTGFLVFEIAIMGALVIDGHGVTNYYRDVNKGYTKNDVLHLLSKQVKENDPSYYRSFSSLASSSASNDGMRNDYNGASFFHSIYNYNTADLCNWSSITGGTAPSSWSGTYLQKRPNLDLLLGTKYYYVEDDYYRYQKRGEATSDRFRYNVPLGYVDITDELNENDEFRVYKNYDYIDFALTYDTLYEANVNKEDEADNISTMRILSTEELYLSGTLVNTKQSEIIDDMKNNHPDINVIKPILKQESYFSESYYYRGVSIDRYKEVTNPHLNLENSSQRDAKVTYYDISSAKKPDGTKMQTLNLSAKQYLTELNKDTTLYEKKGSPVYEDKDYRRWVAVIEAYEDSFPNYDPNGNIFLINSQFSSDTKKIGVDIYFVDENNEIITYDNHNDGYYKGSGTPKGWRGFYITPDYSVGENGELKVAKPAPKIKKIIVVSRDKYIQDFAASNSTTPSMLYVDSYTAREERMKNLKEHMVYDVKAGTNKYTFKTNFDKERIIVTRLAYAKGFTVKMIDANGRKIDRPVFNGQGGLASFVSGTGECSYVLEFYTPYLKTASFISAIAVLGFMSSYMVYFYFGIIRNKEKEVQELLKI